MKSLFVAVDFDGTITTHDWPSIGQDIGAIPVLKKIQEAGHRIILYTVRSGIELAEAVAFLSKHGIKLFGVNENSTQNTWTESTKVYAHLYIDDAAIGTPLIYDLHDRPFVDWVTIEQMLIAKGIIA